MLSPRNVARNVYRRIMRAPIRNIMDFDIEVGVAWRTEYGTVWGATSEHEFLLTPLEISAFSKKELEKMLGKERLLEQMRKELEADPEKTMAEALGFAAARIADDIVRIRMVVHAANARYHTSDIARLYTIRGDGTDFVCGVKVRTTFRVYRRLQRTAPPDVSAYREYVRMCAGMMKKIAPHVETALVPVVLAFDRRKWRAK